MTIRWLPLNVQGATLVVVLASALAGSANETADPFDALDQQLEAQFQDTDATLEENFEALDAALEAGFQRLSDEVGAVWGTENIELPSQNIWIDYSDNRRLRRKFDFERGALIVERIVDEVEDSTSVSDEIKAAVEQARIDTAQDLAEKDAALQFAKALLDDAGITFEQPFEEDSSKILGALLPVSNSDLEALGAKISIADTAIEPIALSRSEFPDGVESVEALDQGVASSTADPRQSSTSDGPSLVVQTEGIETAETILGDEKVEGGQAPRELASVTTEGTQESAEREAGESGLAPSGAVVAAVTHLGNNKKKVQITIPFRKDYLSERARQYIGPVAAEARRRQLPASLVYAVIETESHFNPRARSHIPAFGLMQLVPKSGGLDAYHYVYGEKKVLAPEYFFQPNQNVELGVAYLDLLYRRYLRAIKDDQSRLFCTIAAYNTGAGNVAKAFTGANNVRVAASVINEMSSDEVYTYLLENLPYDETRNYLRKVTAAQARYAETDNNI